MDTELSEGVGHHRKDIGSQYRDDEGKEIMQTECPYPDGCPRLDNQKPEVVLAKVKYLEARVDELEASCRLGASVLKMKDEEITSLKEEIRILKTEEKEEREKIYKPTKREKKGAGKPGAPLGHPGKSREKPREPDKTVDVHLKCCPHCKSRIKPICGSGSFSDHIQEDIRIFIETTLFRHHKYWCSKCGKVVQGIGEGEIPRSYFGPNVYSLAGLFHYDIGVPYDKISRIYNDIFGLPLTTGALIGMDKRVAGMGMPLYTDLEKRVQNSSVSYLDETGWPINGEANWLWHAGNKEVGSLYKIDKHRNHQVAEGILGKDYQGVMVTDCFSAYNLVKTGAKQKCLAHLFRDLDKLTTLYPNDLEVIAFCVNLDNIFHEGLDLCHGYKKGKHTLDDLRQGKEDIEKKIDALTRVKLINKKAETLRKRLIRHKDEIFTFLAYPDLVDPTNNFSERQLRPSVISRKLSFGNKTKEGADRHAIMMSLIQTAKLQKKEPKDLLLSLILNSSQTSPVRNVVSNGTRAPT